MNSGILKGRAWQRPISTIAAVLFTALLVGSFIVLFNRTHQDKTGSDTRPRQVVATVPAAVPTIILRNEGPITSIRMVDATTGWAVTDHAVLRTTDGGTFWQDATPPHASSAFITGAAVAVLNASTVWVGTALPNGSAAQVFHTSNAGQTWQETTVRSGMATGVELTFINATDGWMLVGLGAAAGSEAVAIYRTTDGGETWTKTSSTKPPDNTTPGALPFGGDKNGLSFLNPSTGWATGTEPAAFPWLNISHDGGRTWQHQAIQLPANQALSQLSIMPPTFFNASEGILPVEGLNITTTGGTDIYVTHDGGATWNSTTLVPGDASATNFIDINHGWVADGTMLYMTSDGGQHWTKIFSSAKSMPKFQRLDFVSSEVGWAIGYTDAGTMSLIRTGDGGHTWMQVQYIVYKVAIH